MRPLWFRIGLGSAFVTALLPVLVALFHLLPAAQSAMPAAHSAAASPHHQHAAHHEHAAPLEVAVVLAKASQADCSPSGAPCDQPPRHAVGHCPLCFWLQGLHALPAPDVAAAPLPSGTAQTLPGYEPVFAGTHLFVATQPRAPPISLPVA